MARKEKVLILSLILFGSQASHFLLQIPYVFLSSLERLVVVLIERFPELGKGPQFLCCKAMMKLFVALAQRGACLKPFLSHIGKKD